MHRKNTASAIARNKKARHLYHLSDPTEAGIVLTGPEVKSLRAGQVNFRDSYVEFREDGAWLVGLHIAPYNNAGYVAQDPDRDRKLLLHAGEIRRAAAQVAQKGMTGVPVSLYFKHGRVKVEIALGRGKKLYDHREDMKRRAEERDMEREL
ncbi:MAG: SsrA-binding protein SmpB [Deltaproteobacteria bacterium]|nr:SsrA-binding protein SmpB [Deltaproteobacteria bacterium]